MPQVVKNLVVGGVNVQLKKHGEKGFEVKFAKNLNFNLGWIKGTFPRTTFEDLVASVGAANYDTALVNRVN